jgi:DNA invertase Pin-like site-specific DNA recombinase
MDPDTTIIDRRRCAIYTRKSMVIGLGEEFNSWETQRAICSAYVTSQSHKGWREIARRYDDVGRSGATLERPELQNLLTDIEDGLIDVVLVYKLDRITRSLLHFLRLMDIFERHHVAFVSITQNFDTSDSMGRLIMNVLLTFAQFEREIAADRLRDKTRLIRNSGRWPGGETPLGYKSTKHMLRVVPSEAEKVRFIFRNFLKVGTYHGVERECRERRIRGRRRVSTPKRFYRGSTLGAAAIAFILRNPIYIGLLRAGDELVQGVHHPIIERDLWDRVQALCATRDKRRLYPKTQHNMLSKIVYDCFGRLMLVHRGILRNGQCVEYYASKQNEWCRKKDHAPLWIRGEALERLVCASVKELLTNRELIRSGLLKTGCYDERLEQLCERGEPAIGLLEGLVREDLKQVVRSIVARVELGLGSVQLVVRWRAVEHFLSWDGIGIYAPDQASWKRCPETSLIDVPLSSERRARKLRIWPEPRERADARPNVSLVSVIADARRAQALVEAHRTEPLSCLAARFHRQESYLIRLLRLNYLAPDIIASILDGEQPAGLTRKMLLYGELPLDWALQRRMLGFPGGPGSALPVNR